MGKQSAMNGVSHQSGFTLLEVLVAFVLMAMAVVVIAQSFAGGLRNLARTDSYTTAALVADSQMVQVGVLYPVASGEFNQSDFESESDSRLDKQYRWSISMTPYELEAFDDQLERPGELQLFLVRVIVNWIESGEEKSLQIASLKAGPKEGGF